MCSVLTDLVAINSDYCRFSIRLHPNNQLKDFSDTSAVSLKTRKAQFETSKTLKHFLRFLIWAPFLSASQWLWCVPPGSLFVLCLLFSSVSHTSVRQKQRVDWIIKALFMLHNSLAVSHLSYCVEVGGRARQTCTPSFHFTPKSHKHHQ